MSSPSKPNRPTTVDDLPPEMICELFKHLHLNDLATCSLVNQRWHSIYAGFKVHRLVVHEKLDNKLSNWSHPDRQIEDQELCHLEIFDRLVHKPLVSNLKCLAIFDRSGSSYGAPQSPFNPNKLNAFRQLVHLEIHFDILNTFRYGVALNLPKLKHLALYHLRYCFLSIDCPELGVLVYRGESGNDRLEVKRPETIRKLHTDMVGSTKLAPFKNVECLVVGRFEMISKAILLTLPRLEQLHYDKDISLAFFELRNEVDKIGRTKQALREFVDDAKLLRSDFKFTFAGFQMTQTAVDALDFGGRQRIEYVYMKNWQLVDPGATLNFIRSLDYGSLLCYAGPGEIPMCFFRKFTNVTSVSASFGIQNAKHFLEFLASLSSLTRLELDHPQLGQEFYDQLPAAAPRLAELKVTEDHMLQVSSDFMSRLPRLSKFEIYRSNRFL